MVHKQLNEFHAPIFAWPSVISDRPPVLWWLSPREGWDAVRINCKKGAYSESYGADVKVYGLRGVC